MASLLNELWMELLYFYFLNPTEDRIINFDIETTTEEKERKKKWREGEKMPRDAIAGGILCIFWNGKVTGSYVTNFPQLFLTPRKANVTINKDAQPRVLMTLRDFVDQTSNGGKNWSFCRFGFHIWLFTTDSHRFLRFCTNEFLQIIQITKLLTSCKWLFHFFFSKRKKELQTIHLWRYDNTIMIF